MTRSSLGVVAGRMASMGLGFAFWLLAARLVPEATVGLTAGAVSSMMLCTQLAVWGLGAAFTLRFRSTDDLARLLDSAASMVVAGAVSAGAVALLLARALFDDLGRLAGSPAFCVLFVAMCVLGALNVLLDQVSVAFRRGSDVLVRNVAFGLVAAAVMVVVGTRSADPSAVAVFSAWVVAGVVACVVGVVQLSRDVPGYRPRLAVDRRSMPGLVRSGVPNHVLTLADRAPGLVLPVVVTEMLSPAQNAHWYAAWMMAWAVCIVPMSVGMAIFAEVAADRAPVSSAVVSGTRTSLGVGIAAALCVAAAAPVALSLLGPGYASAGTGPLRILVVSVLPLTVLQVYFAVCRAALRMAEAIATAVVAAVVGVGAAAAVARPSGLTGMAIAWVASQTAVALWAAVRVRTIQRGEAAAPLEVVTVVG